MKVLTFRSITLGEIINSDMAPRGVIRNAIYNTPHKTPLVGEYLVAEEDVIMLKLAHPDFDTHVQVEDYEDTSV